MASLSFYTILTLGPMMNGFFRNAGFNEYPMEYKGKSRQSMETNAEKQVDFVSYGSPPFDLGFAPQELF